MLGQVHMQYKECWSKWIDYGLNTFQQLEIREELHCHTEAQSSKCGVGLLNATPFERKIKAKSFYQSALLEGLVSN